MKHYKTDPRWIITRFAGKSNDGKSEWKKGDRVFYFPLTKTILSGAAAETAAARFASESADEAFMSGDYL
jgi:hypothetical protein